MNQIAFACYMFAGLITLPAIATANDRLVVLATDRSSGSMTVGDMIAYNKTFDLVLANSSDEAIDLTEICLVAQTVDGDSFGLDTVEGTLSTGILEVGGNASGFATFASDNVAVLEAASVHASSSC